MRSGRLLRRRSGGRLLSPQSGKPPDARIILIHPHCPHADARGHLHEGRCGPVGDAPTGAACVQRPIGHPPLVRLRDTVRNGLGLIESVNYLGARIHALDSGPYRLTELDSGPYRLTATLRLRGSVGDWRSLLSSAPHAHWCLQVDKGLWRSEEFGDDAIISQTISHRTGDLRGCPAVRYLAAMTASDSGHLMRTEGQKAS